MGCGACKDSQSRQKTKTLDGGVENIDNSNDMNILVKLLVFSIFIIMTPIIVLLVMVILFVKIFNLEKYFNYEDILNNIVKFYKKRGENKADDTSEVKEEKVVLDG